MRINDNYVLVDNEHDLDEVLKAKKRVIALVYASWCPFCVTYLPVFERHAEERALSFAVVKDDQEMIADRYSVEVVPTVLFFENGKVSKRLDGALGIGLNAKQLTDFIRACTLPEQ